MTREEETKRAIVNYLKAVALFGVIALVWPLFGVFPGLRQVFAVVAASFALPVLWNLFGLWMLRRGAGAEAPEEPEPVPVEGAPTIDGFQLVARDGDEWYQRKVVVGNREVAVDLPADPKRFSASLPHALALIERLPELLPAFDRFVTEQKARLPTYVEELDNLQLDYIQFFGGREPDVCEWVCKESPSGRIWGCAYRDGVFYNFSADD